MDSVKRISNFFGKPIKKVIDNLKNKSPHEQWYYYYKALEFIARTCLQLHCIVDKNKPIGPIAYFLGIFCCFNAFLLIYTTYFYINSGNFVKCLPCYCMFGLNLSVYSMYWSSVLKPGRLWPMLIQSPSKYIYRNDKQPTIYNRICWDGLADSAKQIFLSVTLQFLTVFGAVIGLIFTYFKEGKIFTLYELRMPFFDNDPNTEFLVSCAWEGLISCFGVLGLLLIESGMALINNAISVSSKLNCLSLKELSDQLVSNDITKRKVHQKLKLIFMQIIYWNEYLENVKKLLYWRLFLSPPVFTFSIAISIYSQSVLKYPGGYGLAIASYVQLAIFNYTGQNAINRTDRLLNALNDFKWYLLPKDGQRDLMSMVNFLQNTKGPTIGPFRPLSYMTFKNLTQKMYKFLMFLSNIDV